MRLAVIARVVDTPEAELASAIAPGRRTRAHLLAMIGQDERVPFPPPAPRAFPFESLLSSTTPPPLVLRIALGVDGSQHLVLSDLLKAFWIRASNVAFTEAIGIDAWGVDAIHPVKRMVTEVESVRPLDLARGLASEAGLRALRHARPLAAWLCVAFPAEAQRAGLPGWVGRRPLARAIPGVSLTSPPTGSGSPPMPGLDDLSGIGALSAAGILAFDLEGGGIFAQLRVAGRPVPVFALAPAACHLGDDRLLADLVAAKLGRGEPVFLDLRGSRRSAARLLGVLHPCERSS